MFLDSSVSHRLESAEILPTLEWIDILAREKPALKADRLPIAGGWLMYAGPDSPANHVIGMGLRGPVSRAEFDAVEEFYRQRNSLCEVVVSPYADMSLTEHLGERGYRVTEWSTVLVRRLNQNDQFEASGIEVVRIGAGEARQWAELMARALAEYPGITTEIMEPVASAPSAMCFIARIDGRPAGGGAASVFPQEGMAPLYSAATVPEFRNRGVQRALFQARLEAARAAGCELAVVCTQPGTVSQRNAERNGFRIAYTKAAFQRRF
jgi:GNAT superfamily N-acetyltransferase